MQHPFPAQHDQQQAEAIEILKRSRSFLLVDFQADPQEDCKHPLCGLLHDHTGSVTMIASCSVGDLNRGVNAIGEEIMVTQSIGLLMELNASQREQIAALLLNKDEAFRETEEG